MKQRVSVGASSLAFGLVLAASSAAALGACKGEGGELGDVMVPPTPPVAPDVAAQTGAQRLSWAQYRNVVHDVFGADVVAPPVTALEPDVSQAGFVSVGASYTSVSPRGVEQYETAAYDVAKQVLRDEAKRAAVVPCKPAGNGDEACARAFVAKVGRRLFRRPLEADETARYATLAVTSGQALGDPYKGLEFSLAALLQSPSFLFRSSVGEPDPKRAGLRRYTSYEMASRLSFFFWNSGPDEELLDAAEAGALVDDAGLAEQAKRLLASPRAREGARGFFGEFLGLERLDGLSKDPKIFTTFTPELGASAREETLRLFEAIVFDDDSDYRDIFTTTRTFVNPKLASMYQVASPVDEGFAEVRLPDDGPRAGLLGHISLLALYSHPVSSSPTLRGRFVRTTILCGKIGLPPVNVNTALPEPSGTTLTLRDRVKEHLVDPGCTSCHLRMDPIGLGLENFDGIGRFRRTDNGADIDASGDLDGVPFTDARSLGKAVREHPDMVPCFVKNVYRYATSFVETEAEAPVVDALSYEFAASGHRVKSLMLAVALSPGFRLASPPR